MDSEQPPSARLIELAREALAADARVLVAYLFGSFARGTAAEKELKYSDALKAYQEAAKAKPNDKLAGNKVQFAQAIVNAEQAIANKMWVEAGREVDNALRLYPKNAHALKLQQRVKMKK